MICRLRNLIYYVNAGYATLYPSGVGSEIQAINKTNDLLSVMTVCRNVYHNGVAANTCYKFMKVLPT